MTRLEPGRDPDRDRDPTKPLAADKSLGDLFGDLSSEFTQLLRTEAELAKTEIRDEADKAKRVASVFGIAAIAGYMALLLLSFAVAWALDAVLPTGAAFAIVGAVYAIVAAVLAMRGRQRVRELTVVPPRTTETVKEDVQWTREKIS
jgi:uncharacterized membrane protein YqjE